MKLSQALDLASAQAAHEQEQLDALTDAMRVALIETVSTSVWGDQRAFDELQQRLFG